MTKDGQSPSIPEAPSTAPIPPMTHQPEVKVRVSEKIRPGVIIQFGGFGGPASEFAIVGVWLSYYIGNPAKEDVVLGEDAQYRQVAQFTMERAAWEEFEKSLAGSIPESKGKAVYSNTAILTIK